MLTTTYINKSQTERGELMTQMEPDSITVEEASLLYSLVRMQKPRLVVETGTGHAVATSKIVEALRQNRFGTILSCDTDADYVMSASLHLPYPICGIRQCTGLQLLATIEKADMIFVDAGNSDNRMEEVQLIIRNGLLSPKGLLVIHDTCNPKYMKLAEYVRSCGFVGLSLDSIGGIGFFQRP